MRPAYIHLDRVTKRFGSVVALDQITLGIEEGEFLALLGPSGSGKTTALRLLSGLLRPDEGDIWLGGRVINSVPPHRRNMGLVFQNYSLFPHMTVAENVAYGLRMRRVAKEERHRRVEEALELVQLGGYEDRYLHQLSGGQQQRIALARAFVIRPSAMLLDEPLGALDKKLREEMQIELRALQQRLGITAIFVTHDQEEALTMSDRVAVINMGQLQQIGTPEEIYERPATRFVAAFIGRSNFFLGRIAKVNSDGVIVEAFPGFRLKLSLWAGARVDAGVEVALRPEKIRFGTSPDGLNHVTGRIEQVVYQGQHSYWRVLLANGSVVEVYRPNVGSAAETSARSAEVDLCWKSEDMQVVEGDK